jgi:diadenosine tetraphosphate (Ap4A) HIT family hydrolase
MLAVRRHVDISRHQHVLHVGTHFRIEHATGYRIAGLVFVIPSATVDTIVDMSEPALAELGPTIRLATCALQHVLNPVNVYCARFGESKAPLHFHVFPRTHALTVAYLEDNPGVDLIDAPHVMSWANRKFSSVGGPSHGNIPDTVRCLKDYFARDA